MLQRIALFLHVCRLPYGAIISNDACYFSHLNLCPLEDTKVSRMNQQENFLTSTELKFSLKKAKQRKKIQDCFCLDTQTKLLILSANNG